MTVLDILMARAAKTPDQSALISDGTEYRYADIARGSQSSRSLLEAEGVKSGDFVIIMLDNGPHFFYGFFGCQLLGAIPVPLSPKSGAPRIETILDDCGAVKILVDSHFMKGRFFEQIATEKVRPRLVNIELAAERAPIMEPAKAHHLAFIQYTSGSTGDSKGTMISQAAVMANIEAFSKSMQLRKGDVFSSMMPLFHDMGLICFGLGSIVNGVPLVVYLQEAISLFSWLDGFAKYKVTHSGGPNIFLHLANKVVREPEKYDLSSCRMLVCGSEPIFPSVVDTFETRFNASGKIKPGYGMAEIALCATITAVDDPYRVHEGRTMSCGRGLDNVSLRILTDDDQISDAPWVEGEILIQTPSAMDGYLHREVQTKAAYRDGYYCSGDIGFLDDEGRLYIVGRKKNLIIRGGEKFSPGDLEALAGRFSEIQMSGVISLPPEQGVVADDTIVLVLEVPRKIAKDEAAMLDLAAKIDALSQDACGYKADRFLFGTKASIPLTTNGKMQHQALRKLILDDAFPALFALNAVDLTVRR